MSQSKDCSGAYAYSVSPKRANSSAEGTVGAATSGVGATESARVAKELEAASGGGGSDSGGPACAWESPTVRKVNTFHIP